MREFDGSGQPVRDLDFTSPTYPTVILVRIICRHLININGYQILLVELLVEIKDQNYYEISNFYSEPKC